MTDAVKRKINAIDIRIQLLQSRQNGLNGTIVKKLERQKRALMAKG
jgi:hypothetical protein